MTSELVPRNEKLSLIEFANEASQVHGIAKALANTSFVPKTMQGRPDEITAAILYGREIGFEPMTALRNIDVIEGRPSLSANAQRGLAMHHGVRFEVLESTDTRVQMRAKAPNQQNWTTVDWPIERARKMGLADKANWKKMPQAMLIARATSELCRLVAPDSLIGMSHSTEELKDGAHLVVADVAEPKPRTVQRKPLLATVEPELQAPEPEPAREITAVPEPELDAAMRVVGQDPAIKITEKSRRAIMAGFTAIGFPDRATRLEGVSKVVGREVTSVNDLTEIEATEVIHHLGVWRREMPEDAQQAKIPGQLG